MNRELSMEFVRVTEAAAIACGHSVGRGDKNGADRSNIITQYLFSIRHYSKFLSMQALLKQPGKQLLPFSPRKASLISLTVGVSR